MTISKEQKILLLRYSNFHGVDTITEHLNIEKKYGYCWWAKIGKKPSEKYLNNIMNYEHPIAFLFNKGTLHSCEILEVSNSRPTEGFPPYYISDLYGSNDLNPVMFFKIKSIETEDLSILDDYILTTSGKLLTHDLKKTISSYMLVQHKSIPVPPKKARVIKQKTKPIIQHLSPNDCIYRNNGTCTCKSCINYNYECLHPNRCIKQKYTIKNNERGYHK